MDFLGLLVVLGRVIFGIGAFLCFLFVAGWSAKIFFYIKDDIVISKINKYAVKISNIIGNLEAFLLLVMIFFIHPLAVAIAYKDYKYSWAQLPVAAITFLTPPFADVYWFWKDFNYYLFDIKHGGVYRRLNDGLYMYSCLVFCSVLALVYFMKIFLNYKSEK